MTRRTGVPATNTGQRLDRPFATRRSLLVLGIVLVCLGLLVLILTLAGGARHTPPVGGHATSSGGTQAAVRAGGPGAPDQATRTIEVRTLDTMAFEPAAVEVAAGETITFAITNSSRSNHEFTLGDAGMQEEHAQMMAHMPDGPPHALPNSVRIAPGETKHLTWRFGSTGVLEFACHEPGHYQAGMRGQIAVR